MCYYLKMCAFYWKWEHLWPYSILLIVLVNENKTQKYFLGYKIVS